MGEPGTHRPAAAGAALRIVWAAAVGAAVASCQQVGQSSIDILAPTERQVSFGADVQPILTNNCALSGCHAGPQPAPTFCNRILIQIPPANFEPGQAYGNIVGVRSCESFLVNSDAGTPENTLNRVEPGHPSRSYLFLKISGCSGSAGCSLEPMPLGKAPLGPADQSTIQQWIEQGAQNN